jgi:hypothetical protein
MKASSHSESENLINPVTPSRTLWEKMGVGSLSISLIVHALLLAVGVIWVFQVIPVPDKEVIWTSKGGSGNSEASQSSERAQRARMMLASNVRRVSATGQGGLVLPDIGELGEVSPLAALNGGGGLGGIGSLGSGGGFGNNPFGGSSLKGGNADKSFFKMVPPGMVKRCSKQDRLARLMENGGNPACDDAVANALRWLKSQQNADGSWGKDNRVAMTGLVLLAYFGHCETPQSPEFGDSCMRGIVYLVNIGMKNEGKLASNFTSKHWSYEHAIATYALGEASTFCREGDVPNLPEITRKSGQFIIDNQNKNGGWAYLYATDGGHADVSITGWQIQALKACSHTKLKYSGMNVCISKGLDYINRCQNENGGFGYTGSKLGGSGYFTLTGVGMLCNQMWDKGSRAEVRKGAEYILKESRFDYHTEFCDLYGHYYESQALMRRGGDEWKQYNEMFRDQLINNQDTDGSWKTPGGGNRPRATAATWQNDKLYRTCLCTLMLEVYYRFLNTDGGNRTRPGI